MKVIQTRYNSHYFRSRTEARWSVYFDALGIKWEYEPEGFEFEGGVRYLPDFKVFYPGRGDLEAAWYWFEVKPALDLIKSAEWLKLTSFAKQQTLILLDGVPDLRAYVPVDWVFGICDEQGNAMPILPEPTRAMVREAQGPERQGFVLWHDYERPWSDMEHNVFGVDDEWAESILGGGALKHLKAAVNEARGYSFGRGGRA